jgi:nitroreductase
MNRRAFLVGGAALAVVAGGGVALGIRQMGSSSGYADASDALRAPLPENADWKEIIRFATLAANGHNTQPWRFRVSDRRVEILPDFSRRTPIVDPDDHHLFVNLGCAAENLLLAAGARGLVGEARYVGDGDGSIVIDFVDGPSGRSALFEAIPRRQSTRADFDGRDLPLQMLAQLERATAEPGVQAAVITDRQKLTQLGELVIAGNTRQLADPAFVAELKQWMRFNPAAALESGDGLYSAASGNPTLPTWIGAPMFDFVFTAKAENEKYARQMQTSAGAVVISGDTADPEHWVSVGRSCQRFALQATALGLKSSFVNQPVEVPDLRDDLAALAGLPDKRPDIVIRFGYGPELPKSPRRPVEAVII